MRTVVVTGSASGIGQATAELISSQGERVIGVDLKDADICADLTSEEGRRHLVESVTALEMGIDGVVASAGLAAANPATLKLNYFATVDALSGLRPLLARSTAPRAVVVGSFASAHPFRGDLVDACLRGDEPGAVRLAEATIDAGAGEAIYAASKVAITRWARSAAVQSSWAGHGITLNVVAPGMVDTPMIRAQLADPVRRARLEVSVPMPLRGPAEPAEVARVIGWLVGATNTLVTGQVIYADGGADATLRGNSVW